MFNLVKSSLYRFFKQKRAIVLLIIALAFAVVITGLYAFIDRSFNSLGGEVTGRSVYALSLSATSNVALAIGIIVVMNICQKYTYGSFRNEIIVGNSRTKIFFSNLFVSLIIGTLYYTIYVLFTGLFVGLLFDWGYTFSVGYVVIRFLLSLLVFYIVISIAVLLSFVIKKTGVSILIFIVLLNVISLLSLLSAINNDIVKQIYKLTMAYHTNLLIDDQSIISNADVYRMILSSIIVTVVLNIISWLSFKARDIK